MPKTDPTILTSTATNLAVTNVADYQVADGMPTKCNLFLKDFASAAFGYTGFNGLLANDIFDLIVGGTLGWNALANKKAGIALDEDDLDDAFTKAQDFANQGFLVVVSMKVGASGAEGGHVAVVVPGQLQGSGQWSSIGYATALPFVAQAGRDVFAGKGLSYGIKPADYQANAFAVAVNQSEVLV